MAGQPRKRALIAEIERRTRAAFDGDETKTHLDYLCDWLESGRTALALTHDLNRVLRWELDPVSHGSVTRYFKSVADNADAKIKAARAEGAYAMLDSTADIADEDVESTEDAARARNRIASRQHMSERYNREAFGQKAGGVTVNIAAGSLHLDALRIRVIDQLPQARPHESDEVAGAIAGAIDQEADVLSIEATTS